MIESAVQELGDNVKSVDDKADALLSKGDLAAKVEGIRLLLKELEKERSEATAELRSRIEFLGYYESLPERKELADAKKRLAEVELPLKKRAAELRQRLERMLGG